MIKPTRGYVLISPEKAEDKSANGFYVPENAQEKPQKGVVKAIGEPSYEAQKAVDYPRALEDLKLLENKRVYYKRWAADEIKEEGKEYILVKFENILAVIE